MSNNILFKTINVTKNYLVLLQNYDYVILANKKFLILFKRASVFIENILYSFLFISIIKSIRINDLYFFVYILVFLNRILFSRKLLYQISFSYKVALFFCVYSCFL